MQSYMQEQDEVSPQCTTIFNIYRCRHLCCKDGKIDKKAKAKVSTSKVKKTSPATQHQTTSGDEGETRTPKESYLPRSNSVGIHLHVSQLEEINLAETLERQIIENPYSIAGSSLVNTSKSTLGVSSTFKTTSTPTTDTSQPSKRHDDLIASRPSSHLRSLGTNSPQRRTTWNLSDSISDSDDLPLPENLFTKIMPRKGTRSYAKVPSVQVSGSSVQSMADRAVRDETAVQQQSVKGSDILLSGVAFSIDDIMECVEIV